MEIRHLQTFKTIIDVNGFTKAAHHLGYAQSTVTSHIKAIEDELGNPVFDRIGKTVVLTEAGKHLIPHVLKMLSIYKDLKETASPSGEVVGKLCISAPEALLTYRFPPMVKEFKDEYPSVDLSMMHVDQKTLKKDLKDGKLDVAFILDKETKDEEINFNIVNQEPMMYVLPVQTGHSLASSLEKQVHLFSEEGCSYRNYFQSLLNEYQVQNQRKMEFESIEAIKQCIIHGFGDSVLPYTSVKKEIAQNKFTATEVDIKEPLYTQIAWHKEKWQSPSLKAFLTIFQKYANDDIT